MVSKPEVDKGVGWSPRRPRRRNPRALLWRFDWLRSDGLRGSPASHWPEGPLLRHGGGRSAGGRGRKPGGAGGGAMQAAAEPGNLAGVRHVLLVLSGKGGVGKSTITAELALALRHAGRKVGILDVDLCGPSVPHMLGVQGRAVHQCDRGWVPVFLDRDRSICLMSVGFLLESPADAVVWRGPKKSALIRQFVCDVAWGELDFLLVDTPPGTSDEHLSTVEALRPHGPLGAVVVTTPQAVAVADVRRELTFCRKAGLRVLGLVENMSGLVCPHCAECSDVFSSGGGKELAQHAGVPFLGSVPLDPQLTRSLEEGRDFIQEFPKSPAFPTLTSIAQQILEGHVFSSPDGGGPTGPHAV